MAREGPDLSYDMGRFGGPSVNKLAAHEAISTPSFALESSRVVTAECVCMCVYVCVMGLHTPLGPGMARMDGRVMVVFRHSLPD